MNTTRPSNLLSLQSLILTVGCFGAVASVNANPAVSNLTAAQRAGTKLVDITYDLAAPGFGAVAVTLEASSDGGATWTVPVASATGAVGGSVTPGTGKAIVWNAGVDWLGNYSTQMRFRVVAEDGYSYIPGGSFAMGATSGDTDSNAPPITVTVSPFYIQQTETTKAQWDEVRTWALNNGYTDLAAGAGKASNHPVQTVSWWDVVKWCNARSEKEGLAPVYTVSGAVMKTGQTTPTANWGANGYRLPTEAEWEKAARGGAEGKRFPWGTDTISHAEANFRNNGGEVYAAGTTGDHPLYTAGEMPYTSPVGSFGANGYGLYDMAGNLFEWCWDWYAASSYTTSNGTTDPRGLASGSSRVRRGGTFQHYAIDCRASLRSYIAPFNRSSDNGFRTARTHLLENMVQIPGGSFTMGRTSGDTDSDAPSITVTVSPFYMQQTETTKAQWDEVRTWGLSNGYTDLAAGAGKASNHPVQTVSWWDVVKWCNARSEKEGLTPVYTVSGAVMRTGTNEPVPNWSANGYRLPTEAEWEKAARGGVSGKRFPWGTDTISHAQANYSGSSSYAYDLSPINNYHPSFAAGGFPNTSPVGSFGANGFGLYDVSGNVFEWCWDVFGSSYYTTSNGTTDPLGPTLGTERVSRGGSWVYYAFNVRASHRGGSTPEWKDIGQGFRTARSSVGIAIPQTDSLTLNTRDNPTVTSPSATSVTATDATLGGDVTADGGATITERGVVYSATATNADPVVGGTGVTKMTATGTTGVFTAPVTGLTQGSGYSYKAYATNSHGTTYTSVSTFTTLNATNSIESGLVAFYEFEENANDQSSNGNHAEPSENCNYVSSGLNGKAIRINGDNSIYSNGGGHVILPNFSGSFNSGFAFSLWVKDESVGGSPFEEEAYLAFGALNIGRAEVMLDRRVNLIRWSLSDGLNTIEKDQSISIPAALGQWKHLVFTYQPGDFRGYLNGVLVFQENVSINPFPVNKAALGRHWWDGGSSSSTRMSATFDNVRIYQRALSTSDVETIFQTEGGKNANLDALTLSAGTLSPTFASATTAYTASAANATTSITVTPTRSEANATIEARVNGGAYSAVTSGSPSASLPLNVGNNTVDVRVTAQDGTTQKTYTVTVTRIAGPTVTTPTATGITATGATLGGSVVSLAGGRAVERGVVYSAVATNPDPQLEGLGVIKLPRSGSIGTFTVAASGLLPSTAYAYRAYLTTSIGTSYSVVGYFTTDTPVAFTAGIGTVSNRVIRGGESQLFVFELAQSSAAAFSTTGASPTMQWELRDSLNAVVASGTGNVDFSSALALGGYRLRITNPGSSTETFSLNLDASTQASPRPDVSVGLDPTASSGVDLYDPPAPQQSVLAISTKAAIKNVFFRIDNDGPLPDAMRINGPGSDSRFRVAYVLAGRNVTAAVIAGTATTSVLAAADAPVPLFVRISPNRKNTGILRKVVVNQRPTWVYGRETFGPNGLTVRATTDPTLSDTATFQLNTVP